MKKEKRIKEIEELMSKPNFWENKEKAQSLIREFESLKSKNSNEYTNNNAIITIIAGAGGVDAEDFTNMLFEMYKKFSKKKDWDVEILDKNSNEHDGLKNITFEIKNKNSYPTLKNEQGVHRLVRISPFNAKKQRHTSFALVEVIPKVPNISSFDIQEKDLEINFSKSSGPGGQNVNKRETAVRIKHIPTDINIRVDSERSQAQNKEKAMEILCGKLLNLLQQQRKEKIQDLKIDKTIEWGNQIRSYVLHPYKLVKELRVEYEEKDPYKVLDGEIQGFIDALK